MRTSVGPSSAAVTDPDVLRGRERESTWPLGTAIGLALPFASTCLVVMCAPFERLQPLIVTPWQSLTNLEVVTVAALVLWMAGCWLAGTRPFWSTPLTSPWLLLLAILLASALTATAFSANALHFVGRFLVAFVVFLLTVNAVTSVSRLQTLTMLALAACGRRGAP